MWRRPLLAVFLLTASAGCERPQVIKNVPIGPGGSCKISVGEPRSHVLVRCGPPCASQSFSQGACADGREDACENRCDVYQDVEVCYAGQQVVMLDRLDRVSGRQKWCFWPDPQAEEASRRASRTQR